MFPPGWSTGASSPSWATRCRRETPTTMMMMPRTKTAMPNKARTSAYRVVPEALWELGAEVISIGVEPDGFNINRECGSTAPEELTRKVREMRADIGIALDGDADRVIIADERGRIVDGDQLLAVIAASFK